MRIAIAGLSTESCTFSPLLTRLDDFTLHYGEAFLHRYPFLADFTAQGEKINFYPLMWARALPGGSIETGAYAHIKDELLRLLRDHQAQGRFDGVYLDMHGASSVQHMDDVEGDLIAAIRGVVGADCLISASYDLHGNLSARVVESLDMMTAFRTAPHIDVIETRHKALTMLIKCLREGIRPARAWVRIPLILSGEKTSTEWEPGLSVYASLKESDPVPGVMDASLLVGYVWADEPRNSATVVVTGTDREAITREAAKIAERYWAARDQFDFGVRAGSPDEVITWALAAPESCVFISDAGDNPTGGGVGDVPLMLARLLAHGVNSALVVGMADATAVDTCVAAGVGAKVALSLGGKLDPYTHPPVPVNATVLHIEPSANTEALIEIDGGVKVIMAQRRRPYLTIAEIQRMGVEPHDHKIVVLKIGYLEPDLKKNAPLALLALTPGAINPVIERMPFQRVQRPIYPLDPDMTWTAQPMLFPAGFA